MPVQSFPTGLRPGVGLALSAALPRLSGLNLGLEPSLAALPPLAVLPAAVPAAPAPKAATASRLSAVAARSAKLLPEGGRPATAEGLKQRSWAALFSTAKTPEDAVPAFAENSVPASAVDESGELKRRYEAVRRGERETITAEMRGHRFLLIAGVVRKKSYGYLKPNLKRLTELGLDAEIVKTQPLGTVEENAAIIRRAIRASDKPVVIIAHSKGGIDSLKALEGRPDLQARVSRLVTLQTPYFGSALADWWVAHPWLLKLNAWLHKNSRRAKNFVRALQQISRAERKDLPDERPDLRPGLRLFSLVTRVKGGFRRLLPALQAQAFFLKWLSKSDNDGRVVPEHAIVPGSAFAWLEDIAHSATVTAASGLYQRLNRVRRADTDFAGNLTEALLGWIFEPRSRRPAAIKSE